jgi:hypothetical protein
MLRISLAAHAFSYDENEQQWQEHALNSARSVRSGARLLRNLKRPSRCRYLLLDSPPGLHGKRFTGEPQVNLHLSKFTGYDPLNSFVTDQV